MNYRNNLRPAVRGLALCAATGLTIALAPSATALPVAVPQLREPVTQQSTGAAPVQHPGAPVPEPFSTDYIAGFESDVSSYQFGNYWQVVQLFDHIKAQPEIRQENMDKAVAINNAAAGDQALIQRAQSDAKASSTSVLNAVSDAMGKNLGDAFRASLAEHRLPKTEYLLGNGYAARAGGLANSTMSEKYYFNYQRPYQRAPQAIKRYDDGSKDLYLSLIHISEPTRPY